MIIDTSLVVLDADLTVEAALRRMALRPGARWVVVRRTEGALVYWYSFRAELAHEFLQARGARDSVRRALDLHEGGAAPVQSYGAPQPSDSTEGTVVLDDSSNVIGTVSRDAPPRPGEPRRARAVPSADEPRMPQSGRMGGGGPQATPPPMASPAPSGPPSGGPKATPPEPPKTRSRRGSAKEKNGGARPSGTWIPSHAEPPATTATATAERAAFKAWPDLQAPLAVEEERTFELEVGFASEQVPGVVGGPLVVSDAPEKFELMIQLLAAGFDAPVGWTHSLPVRRDQPEAAKLRIPLVALAASAEVAQHTIAAVFSYEGRTCGVAQRNILVTRKGFSLSPAELRAPKSFANQPVRSVPVWVTADVSVPDLTVTISRWDGNSAEGNFVWSFASPHAVSLPAKPIPMPLGNDAASYTRGVTTRIVELADAESKTLDEQMRGAGRDIADHVPKELWQVIEDIHAQTRRIPDVFLLTAEGCIPWELAWMNDPLEADRPNHLGAQVNLGRWVLGNNGPALPPVDRVDVQSMAVVYGDYKGRDALPEALDEKDKLIGSYGGTPYLISDQGMNTLLDGLPLPAGCQLVHFACHGESDPTRPGETILVMHDGQELSALTLRGAMIGERNQPFLFLNACEVGTAGEQLHELSGFVEAALKSGFRGFVGPLWQVSSTTARDIAIEFYRRTLEGGESVAAVLRDLRGKFRYDSGATPDDTYLAYTYYGHPALRLKRVRS